MVYKRENSKPEVVLDGRLALVCAVDVVESLEGALGPDAESAQVTTWRDLQQVEFVHWQQCNAFKFKKFNNYSYYSNKILCKYLIILSFMKFKTLKYIIKPNSDKLNHL